MYLEVFLFYIKHQTFEVLALGVVDAYRVVGRLCQLVQYAHVAFCHGCGREYRCTEVLLAYNL